MGRLVPEKGFDLALKAFATVIDCFPHTRLVIAGDGMVRWKSKWSIGLTDSVDFVGWVAPEGVPAAAQCHDISDHALAP
jgi:glycogen synthase